MYKLLLSWRYLKTRFIALASIVSVTLGVATLIVVNSVMAGFIQEMQVRLHGILSDVEVAAPGLDIIHQPQFHVDEINRLLGDQVEHITTVVRVPALLHFEVNGYPMTQQIMLLGIDDESFGKVTDFYPYLMNANHKSTMDFKLQEDGYDESLGEAGWGHRRKIAEYEAAYSRQLQQIIEKNKQISPVQEQQASLPQLPDHIDQDDNLENYRDEATAEAEIAMRDPFDQHLPGPSADEIFNPAVDQHTGIVLGMAISNRKFPDPETGETRETYLIRPGDDVHVTMPTSGANMNAVRENFTVVDFYNSKMHEYDSSFAFMPISRMQKLRGMIDPYSGARAVSAIQIKLKPGSDLSEARDILRKRFPPFETNLMIQTWQDTQRPLLSAINMELTILNILLFLIIAVAGFGILATFFMIVVEKTKDIGILKSLGAPSQGVMSIFLGYGLSLGTVGTGVGIVLGLLFVYFINDIAEVVSYLSGREVFDPTIYYFAEIPTIVSPLMVLGVAIGALIIAVLASVLPALRAARMHPVQALRYE